MKFSIYLNRRVFVMSYCSSCGCGSLFKKRYYLEIMVSCWSPCNRCVKRNLTKVEEKGIFTKNIIIIIKIIIIIIRHIVPAGKRS